MKRLTIIIIGTVVIMVAAYALSSFFLMVAWNVIAGFFGLPQITYVVAIAITILVATIRHWVNPPKVK